MDANYIPDELLKHISSFLTLPDHISLRLVNKRWLKCVQESVVELPIGKLFPRCVNKVNKTVLNTLGHIFPNVKSLDLTNCTKLYRGDLISIKSFSKNLEVLILEGCTEISDSDLKIISAYFTKLRVLNLLWCDNISDLGVFLIYRLPYLQELYLGQMSSTKLTNYAFYTIKNCVSLKLLKLHLYTLNSGGCYYISSHQSLEHLEIFGTDGDYWMLRAFSTMPTLKFLLFERAHRIYLCDLPILQSSKSLETIICSNCKNILKQSNSFYQISRVNGVFQHSIVSRQDQIKTRRNSQ
eukprot:TRINITY_DN9754_c0_g1_i1.p1 TRINITY_DN9754_c0_g1~~TRINITY_DN9754_c0_g1_i1.p1  ORF type:complete len:307 (-),score=6.90 TRINITY_DN9754_c0_g1_i1:120-1007(-)